MHKTKSRFNLLIYFFLAALLIGNAVQLKSQCAVGGSFEVTNFSAPNEPIGPGDELEVCFSVWWLAPNCNWFHGIVPTFGAGWEESSIYQNGGPAITKAPFSPIHAQEEFQWFEEGEIFYNDLLNGQYSSGEAVGTGWFNVFGSEGNLPSCSQYGGAIESNCICGLTQQCNQMHQYELCFLIKSKSFPACENFTTADYKIEFNTFSDAETGALFDFDSPCPLDQKFITFVPVPCVEAPELTALSSTVCSNADATLDLITLVVNAQSEIEWAWEPLAPIIDGAEACNSNCDSILNVNLNNDSDSPLVQSYLVTATNSSALSGTVILEYTIQPAITLISTGDSLCLKDCENLHTSFHADAGSNSTFSYDWFGLSEVCPDTTTGYPVIITDISNGCTISTEAVVGVQEGPSYTFLPEVYPEICSDETEDHPISAIVHYSEEINFNWFGGTGSYLVQDTLLIPFSNDLYGTIWQDESTDCIFFEYFEITSIAQIPDVSLIATVDSVCQDSEPVDVLIAEPSGGVFTDNVLDGLFVPTDLGSNTIVYTYTDPVSGCSNYSFDWINVTNDAEFCTLGIEDLEAPKFTLFPNPSNEIINVHSKLPIQQYKIFDHLGRLVDFKEKLASYQLEIFVADWSPGVYAIQINESVRESFVKL